MGRKKISPKSGAELNGYFAYKLYHYRLVSPASGQITLRMRHFCELYGISRYVVYNLIKKHILVTIRCGGRRFVNIRQGCEDKFESVVTRNRRRHQPHKANRHKPYNLGYDHLEGTGFPLSDLPPNTYKPLVEISPGLRGY